eukprot:gene2982-3551_t
MHAWAWLCLGGAHAGEPVGTGAHGGEPSGTGGPPLDPCQFAIKTWDALAAPWGSEALCGPLASIPHWFDCTMRWPDLCPWLEPVGDFAAGATLSQACPDQCLASPARTPVPVPALLPGPTECDSCGYNCDANCLCGHCNLKPGCDTAGQCLGNCNSGHNAKWCGASAPSVVPAPGPTSAPPDRSQPGAPSAVQPITGQPSLHPTPQDQWVPSSPTPLLSPYTPPAGSIPAHDPGTVLFTTTGFLPSGKCSVVVVPLMQGSSIVSGTLELPSSCSQPSLRNTPLSPSPPGIPVSNTPCGKVVFTTSTKDAARLSAWADQDCSDPPPHPSASSSNLLYPPSIIPPQPSDPAEALVLMSLSAAVPAGSAIPYTLVLSHVSGYSSQLPGPATLEQRNTPIGPSLSPGYIVLLVVLVVAVLLSGGLAGFFMLKRVRQYTYRRHQKRQRHAATELWLSDMSVRLLFAMPQLGYLFPYPSPLLEGCPDPTEALPEPWSRYPCNILSPQWAHRTLKPTTCKHQ